MIDIAEAITFLLFSFCVSIPCRWIFGVFDGLGAVITQTLDGPCAVVTAQRDAWQGVAERLALSAPKPAEKPAMTWLRWLRSTG
jgi:hypothetical protein